MADYRGEYGHPYPRVDQYGNPVPPVDQYGNPIPREPAAHSSGTGTAPSYSTGDAAYPAASPAEHGSGAVSYGPAGAAHPHEGVVSCGVAPGETTAFAYEGMLGGGLGATAGTGAQLQPTREEHTTLGETLRRSGSSSSSTSSVLFFLSGRSAVAYMYMFAACAWFSRIASTVKDLMDLCCYGSRPRMTCKAGAGRRRASRTR